MIGYKQSSHSLQGNQTGKGQYRDNVELQFNGSDTRCMWQGLKTITDNKRKTSHVADLDKLNTFFARFEDNTVPPTWPASKDCGLSFSVADVSKTLKRVNPRKAAVPDGIPSSILRASADQLAGLCTGMFDLSLSPICCPHMLQDVYIVPVPKKAKIT
jgi:hypothetical protein